MHPFYKRIDYVLRYSHSNRSQFCKKYKYNYQTLQTYWKSDKLPPGNVLEDLAREYHVSIDTLVLGVSVQPAQVEHPVIRRIVRWLEKLGRDDLLRVEGALRMFGYLVNEEDRGGSRAVSPGESSDDDTWASLESVNDQQQAGAQNET